jgi:hypothetical protein
VFIPVETLKAFNVLTAWLRISPEWNISAFPTSVVYSSGFMMTTNHQRNAAMPEVGDEVTFREIQLHHDRP